MRKGVKGGGSSVAEGVSEAKTKVPLSSGDLLGHLGEMRGQVFLQIEIGQLIGLLQVQKGDQLRIRINLATILGVLQLVFANITVDFTSDIGARHFRTRFLSEESRQLGRNLGGLHKARRSAVSRLSLALGRLLQCQLDILRPLFLNCLVIRLNGRHQSTQLLELQCQLRHFRWRGWLHDLHGNCILHNRSRHRHRCGRRSSNLRNHLGLAGSLFDNFGFNWNGDRSRSRSRHFTYGFLSHYTLYRQVVFK